MGYAVAAPVGGKLAMPNRTVVAMVGDGSFLMNGFEVATGFNPTLGSSTPDMLSEIQTAIEFKFNAANGVGYRIEATEDLSNPWEMIETDIVGEGDVVKRLYSIEGQSNRFFRARRD